MPHRGWFRVITNRFCPGRPEGRLQPHSQSHSQYFQDPYRECESARRPEGLEKPWHGTWKSQVTSLGLSHHYVHDVQRGDHSMIVNRMYSDHRELIAETSQVGIRHSSSNKTNGPWVLPSTTCSHFLFKIISLLQRKTGERPGVRGREPRSDYT